ncbi:MAG TPA: hypothetical protein VGR73_20310 [Bryobacteraceae bacterium]|nr:hypothetical protein [Bryobacteraceae bacterium]
MAVEAQGPVNAHLSEEAVENYAVGRLPKDQLASFEEHLLLCAHCQEQLAKEDDFAEAMRSLAGMDATPLSARSPVQSLLLASPSSSPPTSSPGPSSSAVRLGGLRFRFAQVGGPLALRKCVPLSWAAAYMLAVAISIGSGIVAWKLPLDRNSAGDADVAILTTLRGGNDDGMAQARALRPLDLSIDLAAGDSLDPSAAVNSLPESGRYRIEMVDAAGALQWTGTAQPVSGKLTARVEKHLGAGVYWVRLHGPSGKLLREFGLRVSK